MAEDHRRVETRQIVGTGMATDPARLQEISDEAARRERAWRDAPVRGFGEVIQSAPAKGALADDVEPDPRQARAPQPEPTPEESATPALPAAKKATSSKPLPRVPDPRERLMRARMAAIEGAAKLPAPQTPGESASPPPGTPPTGSRKK
ncbi:MAG: hypothetical protein Q8O67_11440 [Deltaproteobacteria bacterium]|nr:hypothetical protein [Deltaproteobacteria bacterium]